MHMPAYTANTLLLDFNIKHTYKYLRHRCTHACTHTKGETSLDGALD